MSARKLASTVLLTSVTTSGTTDSSGAYHEDYDLAAHLVSGAVAAVFHVHNTSSSPRWAGCRSPGKTNPWAMLDMSAGAIVTMFCPLLGGSAADLYCENNEIQFRLQGFLLTSGGWVFFDPDGTLPVLASSGGVQADVTAPADVTGATALLMKHMAGAWCPFGETTPIGTNASGHTCSTALLKVDGSRRVRISTSVDSPIMGYCTAGAQLVTPWRGSALAVTADETWRAGGGAIPTAQFIQLGVSGSSGAQGFGVRRQGEAPTGAVQAVNSFVHTTAVDDDGEHDYNAEASFAGTPYALMYLTDEGSGGAAAALSAGTPSGTIGTQTTATIGATTDQATGNFYVVVDSSANLAGVTATQIKAGQHAGGTAALASGDVAVSTTSPSVGVAGLLAGTSYAYAAIQNNANGDSNIVTGTFTTASAGAVSGLGRLSGYRIATLMMS